MTLRRVPGGFALADLDSTNGIFLIAGAVTAALFLLLRPKGAEIETEEQAEQMQENALSFEH